MLKLLVLFLVTWAACVNAECEESDQIECAGNTRCTRISYICDNDNDCGDYSDESSDLCALWKGTDCSRGSVRNNDGDCISIIEYCNTPEQRPTTQNFDMRICQMVNQRKIQSLDSIILPSTRLGGSDAEDVPITENLNETLHKAEYFMALVPETIKHDKCPLLYTQLGDECISFFFFGNMTWGESEKFCEVIGGQLYIPQDEAKMNLITQHIRSHDITSDFWIGGNFLNNTVGWRWIDNEPMKLHTNNWAIIYDENCVSRDITVPNTNITVVANEGVCYHYYQAPYLRNPIGSCVAMTYKRFHFMSDEDCSLKKSPICKLSK